MGDFSINEMCKMQKTLQEKYKEIWEPISPEIGKNKLLWMIGEIGEVIDIVKKHGGEKACKDSDLRRQLIDVFSRMQIEKKILQYKPTMLLVEHDVRFQEKAGTDIIRIE